MVRKFDGGAVVTAVLFVAAAFAVIGFGIVLATNQTPPIVKSKRMSPEEAQREMRLRWNRLAEAETEPGLHWAEDEFPNPMFRGGELAEYRRFYRHLATFVEHNFDWLAAHELFDKAVISSEGGRKYGRFLRYLIVDAPKELADWDRLHPGQAFLHPADRDRLAALAARLGNK